MLIRWEKKVESAELREGYNRALEEAIFLNTHYWFLDLRRRGPLPSEDEQWILHHFLPKLENTISGKHYFAYLVAPTHVKQIDITVGLERLKTFSPTVSIQIFSSEDVAINWLLNMQRAESMLAD